jgi:hypothetical protein
MMTLHTLHEVDTLHLEFCNKFFVVFHGDSTIQVLLLGGYETNYDICGGVRNKKWVECYVYD